MKVWTILKKELRSYFASPIAYVLLGTFALVSGYFFSNIVSFFHLLSVQSSFNPMVVQHLNLTDGVLRPFFRNVSVILLFLLPILTMRLLAEEKRTGTAELLFTYPVKDGEILLGKFLAALLLYTLMLALTLGDFLLLAAIAPLERGPLLTGYLGLFLQGMAFIALGTLASSLTENQIVAAVVAFGGLLLFWVIGWVSDLTGPATGKILSHLSLIGHLDPFTKGVIESKDVIYYVNFTILFLFLTLRSLESKRWRG